jgi:hypothetical protein
MEVFTDMISSSEGNNFVALQDEDKPKLYKGMKVVLLGDSRGYVLSSFNPGEEVTIIRLDLEPFKV